MFIVKEILSFSIIKISVCQTAIQPIIFLRESDSDWFKFFEILKKKLKGQGKYFVKIACKLNEPN